MQTRRRTARRSSRSRAAMRREPEDVFSGILVWQVLLCGMLLSLLYYGQRAGNAMCEAAAVSLQTELQRPAMEVFAPAVQELEDRFNFDYTERLFSQLQQFQQSRTEESKSGESTQSQPSASQPEEREFSETDLPMGGQFFVAGEKEGLHLPPEGASLAPAAVSLAVRPPLSGRITSPYGYRSHPVTEMLDFHTGIDIAAPEGTTIRAALPGWVEEVGDSPIYGNYVVLRHSTGLQTRYCHCSAILVEEGLNMRQGEAIALVGHTGVATGPHLHFEIRVDGVLHDPLGLLEGVVRTSSAH